ncbi:hypothetical protein TL16_g09827 [Triparma laevis f. inornata]|uniref:Uncharacterized protein n=2 Tax=Triparma laevis TaxID=1534972 RepID=A0A9W7FDD8_9STRA|nr:hypothetical protein TL16_g09827 [Triparma laevis f. inornata]GMI10092.1 hypothetical protein TrLO_g2344 [Triparma laevis f. longispina]
MLKAGSLSFYEARTDKDAVEAIMFQPSTVIADQLSTTGTMKTQWFVNGQSYFSHLYDALSKAKWHSERFWDEQ